MLAAAMIVLREGREEGERGRGEREREKQGKKKSDRRVRGRVTRKKESDRRVEGNGIRKKESVRRVEGREEQEQQMQKGMKHSSKTPGPTTTQASNTHWTSLESVMPISLRSSISMIPPP